MDKSKKPIIITITIASSVILPVFFSQCLAGDEGEYAPPDAFIDGSSHPYYGSGP